MIKPQGIRVIEFEIPLLLPLLGTWQRMHWAQRRKAMKYLAWHITALIPRCKKPLERCRVTVERRSSGRQPDHENLYASIKPLMDVLVVASKRNPHGIGLIRDDAPSCVIEPPVVRQVKVRRTEHCTVARIEEVI